jgi:hypothetical protein
MSNTEKSPYRVIDIVNYFQVFLSRIVTVWFIALSTSGINATATENLTLLQKLWVV